MMELAYNLESFNPAFTAVLLKVHSHNVFISAVVKLAIFVICEHTEHIETSFAALTKRFSEQ